MDAAGRSDRSLRRFILCADDYGISPAVSKAIRELAGKGRLNAVSVMVAAPSFDRAEAALLAALQAAEPRLAIGLHLTLTAPFGPLTPDYAPMRDGRFLALGQTLAASFAGRLDRERLAREVEAQFRTFTESFARAPDFVDGHQHVQLFPQIREAVVTTAKSLAPKAWLRQCGGRIALGSAFADPKGYFIARLSRGFRRRAEAAALRTNPAFTGTYDFKSRRDYAGLFAGFLDRTPEGGVIMCHPGFVDRELMRLDRLTAQREAEYAFFAGAEFPELLKSRGMTLA